MQLNITFRHLDPIDSLKNYTREKVDRAHKYLDKAGEAHVVLSMERHLHHADITITSGAFVLRGREKSEDMYASIDLAMDKIERQLRRYKERLKHHHGRDRVHHRQDLVANHFKIRHDVVELLDPEKAPNPADATPRVIRSNEFLAKPMLVDEAIMQMDLMNNDFLVFTNAQSNEMNVVYRRKDGHYGLIEASATRAQANVA
ncbi:MAG: ribosome-associated translation inhibitor RaiA [Myxococcaceae bacterium]|nr:ribosome-associated translation inhibitor RaiA [Myxococcaceae bacterium]